MPNIQKALALSLGLSDRECRIYLAALALGVAPITEIAKGARIPRTSAYGTIQRLSERGLLEFYRKRGRQYYAPRSPEKLLSTLTEQREAFSALLPRLKELARHRAARPIVRILEGNEGIRTVLREILDERRPFRGIVGVQDMRVLIEDYFEDFIRRRISQRLHVQLLTNRDAYSLQL